MVHAGVTIASTKPDKYDRYLVDVYLAIPPLKDEVFLNNVLLASGYAVRKEAWEFGDWDGG